MTAQARIGTYGVQRAAIGVLVVVSAALCGGCTGVHGKSSSSSSGLPSAATSTASGASTASVASTAQVAALPAAQATIIKVALTSSDPAMVDKVLAPAVRGGYNKQPFALLPPGSSVTFDSPKLTITGDVGTMPVTVTGGPGAGRWLLLLQNVNGTWLLFGTRKA
jgi:hypothetical protein